METRPMQIQAVSWGIGFFQFFPVYFFMGLC